MNLREFEGTAGDVDDEDFGPIFIERGRDNTVVKARAGVRGRVYEVSAIEAAGFTPEQVGELVAKVFLVRFTGDYYRGKVDTISLSWPDGTTHSLPYPA